MPFYMDIHLVGNVSIEDTRKAHLKDLAVQEKYGVIYHQYWFNEEAGTVYCLMEGPDKASCEATHREANGLTACQLVEVEGGMYELFMGKSTDVDHGLVRAPNGEPDPGYRFILTLNITVNTHLQDRIDLTQLKLPKLPRQKALQQVADHGGNIVETLSYDCLTAVFCDAETALKCAHKIREDFLELLSGPEDFSFTMGISIGKPLTETSGFFTEGIEMSRRLCLIATDKEILTLRHFEQFREADKEQQRLGIRSIKPSEKIFLDQLLDIIEEELSNPCFGVESLSRTLGMSQPQLYRKVHAITGRSPVAFIRDLRLTRALALIRENRYNLSQIALEVGYSSPSYFSKCFQDKYGLRASQISV